MKMIFAVGRKGGKMDLIDRQAALDELNELKKVELVNAGNKPSKSYWALQAALMVVSGLPSAQQKIIRCKDCDWWTKQEDSLQGRCDRYGVYPTGYWYCAGARERREE